jgi:uncharacterized protein DUF3349
VSCSSTVHLSGEARSPNKPEYLARRVPEQPRAGYAITIDNGVTLTPSRLQRGVAEVNTFIAKIVAWINAGYPEGVPGPDRVPLLALLNRRLSDDEVKAVAQGLIERGEFDHVDIGVLITQTTDELPLPVDVERVRERLAAKGWPLDDPRDGEPDATDRGEESA